MRTRDVVLAGVAVLVSAACNPFHHDPAVTVNPKDVTLNSSWHANLATPSALAGAVQMNGGATMAPNPSGNSTKVTLDLANAAPGGIHPWEAHMGQCGEGMDNGVFGPNDAYKPVKVGSDGRAEAVATVSVPTPTTGEYFVVVRASAANPETILACGNLAPPTQ
jgi:hypothetical protein